MGWIGRTTKEWCLKSTERSSIKATALPGTTCPRQLQSPDCRNSGNFLIWMHLSVVGQVMILSSSYFIVLKSLLLRDSLKRIKIQHLAQRHYQKILKRHVVERQDLPQSKADKSETGLGQTTDISLRTYFLPFRRMPMGGTHVFPSHKNRDVWKPHRVSSSFTADQRKS